MDKTITIYRKLVPLSYSGLFMASIIKYHGVVLRHDIKNHCDVGICYFDYKMPKNNVRKHNAYINKILTDINDKSERMKNIIFNALGWCAVIGSIALSMYVFSNY